jgi:hypothetical protein
LISFVNCLRASHPLYLPHGWIERELMPRVAAARESGGTVAIRSLRLDRLIEGGCKRVAVDDPGVVINLKVPADLQGWLATRACTRNPGN